MSDNLDPLCPPAEAFVYAAETHYDDLDGQMILHHPRYLVFVERAQQAWFEAVLQAPRFDWQGYPDMYHVVRRLEIEYLRPIAGVKRFLVLLRCVELRAAVMTTAFEIWSADGTVLHARGQRSNCKVSPVSHEPTLWSEAFQKGFAARLWTPPAVRRSRRGALNRGS